MKQFHAIKLLLLLAVSVMTAACNSDNDLIPGRRPTIEFDTPDGVYTVKIGHELRIAPLIGNGEGASYEWTMDGNIISHDRDLIMSWPRLGSFYVMLTVTTPAGTASEEARVDVLDKTPPVIDFAVPESGIYILTDQEYVIAPRFQHSEADDGFRVRWSVNGVEVSNEMALRFRESETGVYRVKVVAENEDGTDELNLEVNVVDRLPRSLSFRSPSLLEKSTVRYTFAGRPVVLRPDAFNIDAGAAYEWSVNGRKIDGVSGREYVFTPDAAGAYNVVVSADGVQASVEVVCVDATEESRRRNNPASAYPDKVWEYIPAPGQFIGDYSSEGGMPESVDTPEAAALWAKDRMDKRLFVSLGACGGYIIVGFGHSIPAGKAAYDIAVWGNSYDSSNEPGTVWVMQDVNGNGRPDDEWYELKGSEYSNPQTRTDYAVTYYRPAGTGMDVEWSDNRGGRGLIDFMKSYHDQKSYYPAWITSSTYTLYCTRLPENGVRDKVTGQWHTNAFDWGYADNNGSDSFGGSSVDGTGQCTGLKISNAVLADGSPIKLQYVDFVCIRSAVMQQLGILGESSTEVLSVADYSLVK